MSEPKLNSFVVYNPTFGTKEGHEHQKIMYYYPESENSDVKVNNIGLCEALVQFTMTFCPSEPCESLHTQKQKQIFIEPEKDFWFIMTVSSPWRNVVRDGKPTKEYLESHLSEIVLKKTVERAYKMFKYLQNINVGYMDILDVFNGMTFVAQKRSGLERSDTHIIYRFLMNKFQKKSPRFENELDCSYLTHDASCGRFLACTYSSHCDEPHVADVYLHRQGHTEKAFMVIYRALDVTIALFIAGDSEPSTDTLRRLDTSLGESLAEFSSVLESFPHLQFDSSEQQVSKFIYFNAGNLSIHSSFHHRDKSGTKRYRLPTDVMTAILTLSREIASKTETSEVISKTSSDHWVIANKLDDRHECYIVSDQKNANLIDVYEEIRKVCQLQISKVLLTD